MVLLDLLKSLSTKHLKEVIRLHNLHEYIKLGQPRDALINDLIKHFDVLNANTLVSKIHELTIPQTKERVKRTKPVVEAVAVVKRKLTTPITKRIKAIVEPVIEEPVKRDLTGLISSLKSIRDVKKQGDDAIKDVERIKAENELMKYTIKDHHGNYSSEKTRLLGMRVGKYRRLEEEHKIILEDIKNKLVDKFIKSFKRRPSKPTIQEFEDREMRKIPEWEKQYDIYYKYVLLRQKAESAHMGYIRNIPNARWSDKLKREKRLTDLTDSLKSIRDIKKLGDDAKADLQKRREAKQKRDEENALKAEAEKEKVKAPFKSRYLVENEKLLEKRKPLLIEFNKEQYTYKEISKQINKLTDILVDKFIKGFKKPPKESTITRYKDHEINRDKTMYDLNIQETESRNLTNRLYGELRDINQEIQENKRRHEEFQLKR